MGRSSAIVRLALMFIVVSLVAALTSCSSASPTRNTIFPVPANIVSRPPTLSLLTLAAPLRTLPPAPRTTKDTAITTPVTFLSSNTAVLTIANNGLACAGTWDSLTAPQICTPGPVGVAQVTATSHGVSSPPTTVYVHQHIDKIVVSPVPGQTPPAGPAFPRARSSTIRPPPSAGGSTSRPAWARSPGSPSTPRSPPWRCLPTARLSRAW